MVGMAEVSQLKAVAVSRPKQHLVAGAVAPTT
jgi:hypothetical protein